MTLLRRRSLDLLYLFVGLRQFDEASLYNGVVLFSQICALCNVVKQHRRESGLCIAKLISHVNQPSQMIDRTLAADASADLGFVDSRGGSATFYGSRQSASASCSKDNAEGPASTSTILETVRVGANGRVTEPLGIR